MKIKKEEGIQSARQKYTAQFKAQVLEREDRDDGVCDALTMALWRRKLPKDVIVHSDRDSQYCSVVYQKLLGEHQLICSMSKKGDC